MSIDEKIKAAKDKLIVLQPKNHSDMPSMLLKIVEQFRACLDISEASLAEVRAKVKELETKYCDQCGMPFISFHSMLCHRKVKHPDAPDWDAKSEARN